MSEPLRVLADRFRLLRRLARGGMGELWIAEHVGLGAEVVVKLIAPEHADHPGAAARFAIEAAAAARVNSPYVVKVIDYGVADDGRPFLVMEKLEGRDLAAHLAARGRLEPEHVARVVGQIAQGLAKAHAMGIVHRDVKPSNVFLCDAGGELAVKLLDFGVAKRVEAAGASTAGWLGTPAYMSPEQIVGAAEVDARSDVWSLGVLAFECLTGRKPWEGATVGAIALAIHTQPAPRVTELAPQLPPALDAWFARACARDVAHRFASAEELARDLARALGTPSIAPLVDVATLAAGDAPPTLTAAGEGTGGAFTRSAAAPPKKERRALVASTALVALVAVLGAVRAGAPAPRVAAVGIDPMPSIALAEARPSTALANALASIDAASPGAQRRASVPPPRDTARRGTTASEPLSSIDPAPPPPPLAPAGGSLYVMPDERH